MFRKPFVSLAVSLPLVVLVAAAVHAGGEKKPGATQQAPRSMRQSVSQVEASIQSIFEARESRKKAREKSGEALREKAEEEERERERERKGLARDNKADESEEEEEGLDYLEALLYWLRLRAYPQDEWDWSRADVAIAQKKRMPSTLTRPANRVIGGANSGPANLTVNGVPSKGGAPVVGLPGSGSQANVLPDGAAWEFVGPRNWDGGRITGRINGMAIDPVNTRIAYAASAGGGVWKTLDNGVNWTPLTDQKLDRLHTTCVAINPRNTRQVLVGLGDHHGGGNPGRGIARSLDGGLTWSYVGPLMSGSNVSAIVFDPDINNLVMASGTAGVFRSTNGGATWTRVNGVDTNTALPGGDYTSLTVSARNPATNIRRYYAANRSGNANAGIYRSDDRGLTWQLLAGSPLRYVNVPGLTLTGIEVAASPVNPDTVYFSEGDGNAEDGRLWRSDNAGATLTWIDITGTTIGDNDWNQVWYDHYLASSARLEGFGVFDVLYSGLFPAQSSASGTSNWKQFIDRQGNPGSHVDQQGIGIDPKDPSRAIIVNDGGAYMTMFSGGANGQVNITGALNATLGVTQFYHADWHPTNPDIMLGGTQDNSTAFSPTDLYNWQVKANSDGMSVGIVDEAPQFMYASTQSVRTIFRSTNGGASFGGINPGPPDYADGFGGDVKPWKTILYADPILESPVYVDGAGTARTSPVVFVATDRLWRHGIPDKDMDMSLWTERLGGTVLTNGTQGAYVTCIQVVPVTQGHPGNPFKTITSGNFVYVGSSDGAVWMTRNAVRTAKTDANGIPIWSTSVTGDVTWQKLNAPAVGTQLPAGAIASISVNPVDPYDVIVGIGGSGNQHLWRCANTSTAWSTPQGPWLWTPQSGFQGSATALPDAIVVGITRDPYDPQNTYYIATDYGVFATADGGSTWADIGKAYGLPNVEVTTIKAIAATGYLNIATYGRGMWRIPLVDQSGFALDVTAGVRRVPTGLDVPINVNNISSLDATNVRITAASMRTERTNINVNTSTPLPVVIGALGAGTGDSRTIHFNNNAALTSGTFVNLKITVQCTVNTQTKTVVKTVGLRIP